MKSANLRNLTHLLELRAALAEHCRQLKRVAVFIEQRKTGLAVSVLGQSVSRLEAHQSRQLREIKVELRKEQLRLEKKKGGEA